MSTAESQVAEKEPRLLSKWLKLLIADKARLLADNQKTLDRSNRLLDQDADYEQHLSDVLASERFSDRWWASDPLPKQGDDAVEINIDSPKTITYPPPQAVASLPKSSGVANTLGKAALTAALLGMGVGGGLAVPWLMGVFSQQPPAVEAPGAADTDTTRRVEVEVWRPEE